MAYVAEKDEGEAMVRRPVAAARAPWTEAPPAALDRVAGRLQSALDVLEEAREPTADVLRRPLSQAQEVLLSNERSTGGTTTHIIPRAYRLRGSLDGDALARALDVLVKRHEALRTTFAPFDGSMAQQVAARGMTSLRRVDLGRRPAHDRETAVRRLLRREARRPFDIRLGPVLRAVLVRTDTDRHILMLTVPATVADEWSMRLLWRELGEAYTAERAGRPVTLSPPAHRLASFADREFEPVARAERRRLATFWKRALDGVDDSVGIPQQAVRGHHASRESVGRTLDSMLVGRLRALGRERHVSLFMILVAAYSTVLRRYGAAGPLLIAAPIVNRRRPELEWMAGCFTATLPLRVDIREPRDFGELLDHVRAAALDTFDHAGLPDFPPGAASPHSAARTYLSLDDAREEAPSLAGLEASRVPIESPAAGFDFALHFERRGDELAAIADFRADVYASSTARRLLDHVVRVLRAVSIDPDQPIDMIGIVDGAERRQLLSMGRGPLLVAERGATVWSLFETQAQRTPQAVAAVWRDEQATYARIHKDALRIAAGIKARGLGDGARIGVSMEPGLDLIPAVLGIMAAGAACVPLPRGAGARAVANLISDSELAAVIDDHGADTLVEVTRGLAVDVLAPADLVVADPTRFTFDPSPMGAAWVTYATDAQGRPRGTVIEHQALASRFLWQNQTFPLRGADAVLQWADVSQPSASLPLFPLIAGARIVIPADGPPWQELRGHRVAYLCLSPACLEALLAERSDVLWRAPALRAVVCIGEAPSAHLEESFRSASVGAGRADLRLHLVYSRPETSGAATHREVPPTDRGASGLSLGRPIANVRVYVVDERGALCPFGAPGEIWIGGRPVARGYHERRDLTSERFFRDPFASGGHVVRTGDAGRWRPDGQLEYLGHVPRNA